MRLEEQLEEQLRSITSNKQHTQMLEQSGTDISLEEEKKESEQPEKQPGKSKIIIRKKQLK